MSSHWHRSYTIYPRTHEAPLRDIPFIPPCSEPVDTEESVCATDVALLGNSALPMEITRSSDCCIDVLPDDLLREIFVASLPERRGRVSVKSSPLLLSRIRRAWRGIALSESRLWDAFSLEVDGTWDSDRVTQFAERCVAPWLNRSGARPLTISLELLATCTEAFDFAPLLTAFIDNGQSRRWENLHLVLPNWQNSLLRLNDLVATDVPRLRTVSIGAHKTLISHASHLSPISLGFLRADTLRKLTIPADTLIGIDNNSIQWRNLETLNIADSCTLGYAGRILKRCTRLKDCTFTLKVSESDTDGGATFPESLISLSITVDESAWSSSERISLSHLKLPNLCKLYYSGEFAWGSCDLLSLFPSSDRLETLTIDMKLLNSESDDGLLLHGSCPWGAEQWTQLPSQ
ncbi:hypothetical protein DFH06DRAFT_1415424, partial [Mycena polygramma]